MRVRLTAIALIMSALFASHVLAQTVGSEVQRDINQENRVEQGLKSGQLGTGEAASFSRNSRSCSGVSVQVGSGSPEDISRVTAMVIVLTPFGRRKRIICIAVRHHRGAMADA